jgi:hypothetical protein
MNNQFPKMIYRGSGHMVVDNQEQFNTMTAEGWTINPSGMASAEVKDVLTIDQVRGKATFYMEKFEKWNGILKRMEAETGGEDSFKVEDPDFEEIKTGEDGFVVDGQIQGNAAVEHAAPAGKPAPVVKKATVKKPARKPAKKPVKKITEKPATQPVAAPEG